MGTEPESPEPMIPERTVEEIEELYDRALDDAFAAIRAAGYHAIRRLTGRGDDA